ncbi:MAG: membrane dipeptidase [Thermodesulfobacteriota bacterium]
MPSLGPSRLAWRDHRADPAGWARELGVSREAVELYLASDVIDLHVDSFIWTRVFAYDLRRRHGHGLLGARFYSQVDFPRVREAALTGATWVITTHPLRRAAHRTAVFLENVRRLQGIFESVPEDFAVVRSVAEYRRARAAGKHGAFIGIQGGNALDASPDALDLIPDDLVVRITLVHLSSSSLGATSAPVDRRRDQGLTDAGREYVRRMNAKRILVDLAHVNRAGFFDAVAVHDRTLPFLVTHTGIAAVHRHWRNLDDDQLRAVADGGGTIGIMYHAPFLGDPWAGGRAETIVRHLAHVVDTVGEDHASLGSDWDGAINPPRDMPTVLELPRLVDLMLRRGWSPERIGKVLGGNFLRVVEAVRG